jgi:hypothetical protein
MVEMTSSKKLATYKTQLTSTMIHHSFQKCNQNMRIAMSIKVILIRELPT